MVDTFAVQKNDVYYISIVIRYNNNSNKKKIFYNSKIL